MTSRLRDSAIRARVHGSQNSPGPIFRIEPGVFKARLRGAKRINAQRSRGRDCYLSGTRPCEVGGISAVGDPESVGAGGQTPGGNTETCPAAR